jgi:hypothetical protein
MSRVTLLALLLALSAGSVASGQGGQAGGIDPLAVALGATSPVVVCPPDTMRDVKPHRRADPDGPESRCLVPSVVDMHPRGPGPSRAGRGAGQRPIDDGGPSDSWLWPVEALRDLLFGGDGEGQLP